jgi:hypothetical protein
VLQWAFLPEVENENLLQQRKKVTTTTTTTTTTKRMKLVSTRETANFY